MIQANSDLLNVVAFPFIESLEDSSPTIPLTLQFSPYFSIQMSLSLKDLLVLIIQI